MIDNRSPPIQEVSRRQQHCGIGSLNVTSCYKNIIQPLTISICALSTPLKLL